MQSQSIARNAKQILSRLCDFLFSYSNSIFCSMFYFDFVMSSTIRSVFLVDFSCSVSCFLISTYMRSSCLSFISFVRSARISPSLSGFSPFFNL